MKKNLKIIIPIVIAIVVIAVFAGIIIKQQKDMNEIKDRFGMNEKTTISKKLKKKIENNRPAELIGLWADINVNEAGHANLSLLLNADNAEFVGYNYNDNICTTNLGSSIDNWFVSTEDNTLYLEYTYTGNLERIYKYEFDNELLKLYSEAGELQYTMKRITNYEQKREEW